MFFQYCFLLAISQLGRCKDAVAVSRKDIEVFHQSTQTVYGFLDFTTTIGKTVIIFSPQSAPSLGILELLPKKEDIIQTKPLPTKEKPQTIHPTKLSVNSYQNKKSATENAKIALKDFIKQPDYDLLSRQPETFAEESYHVVDLLQRKRNDLKENESINDTHPVGLVTTLSEKFAIAGIETIRETSVIGTYISGKYAQIIQSNTRVFNKKGMSTTLTQPLIKTESLFVKHFNAPVGKYKSRASKDGMKIAYFTSEPSPGNSITIQGESLNHKTIIQNKRNTFIQRPQQQAVGPVSLSMSTKFRSSGRWHYKSLVKPRVYIRKASDLSSINSVTHTIVITDTEVPKTTVQLSLADITSFDTYKSIDKFAINESSSFHISSQMPYLVETINVDSITPSNFEDIYYEIATIKTPYSFQVGATKKTRFVTVTSTIEKSLETDNIDKLTVKGAPIENILAPSTKINQLRQVNNITTFRACTLTDSIKTPSLDYYVDTFTQSHLKLKTQVFPIVDTDSNINYLTFMQTYDITKIIASTKTTPVCVGNNNFYEFNSNLDESGSEIHLDLQFADFSNEYHDSGNSTQSAEAFPVRSLVVIEEPARKSKIMESSQNLYFQFSPDQRQQLAYMKLVRQNFQDPQLNALSAENRLEKSSNVSHVIPIIQGQYTRYQTVSKLISRTSEVVTPQPYISLNPFGLQQTDQFKLVTSATILPTVLTETLSRILRLTFGAKTALTTIFSTNIISKDIPTFITRALPVVATDSFENFFQPAYPHFQFIG